MRVNKFFIVTLFLFTGLCSFAQQKSIVGIWELKKTKNGSQILIDVPLGLYKLFNADSTFSNMRLTKNGAVLSHEGTYKLAENSIYSESLKDQSSGMIIDEKQTQLNYKISEDGNMLTLEGTLSLNSGATTFQLYEEWKKVKVENP